MQPKRSFVTSCVCVVLLFTVLTLSFHLYHNNPYIQGQHYIKLSRTIQQNYLAKLAIYTDYTSLKKESLLRTYLLPYHLKAARGRNPKPIVNDQEISTSLSQGLLVKLDEKLEAFCFFYNVPHKYRYLSPHANQTLIHLGERFQKVLKSYQVHHQVKFAISSALRPVSYQKQLGKNNANASLVSSHSYGESFDIFYDEFYVFLPVESSKESKSKDHADYFHTTLRRQLGFLLGQSLRRQLRSVLTEAILQLQEEKKIYAVLEKKQRCYHITPR